jgi:protein ImuB
MVSLGERIECGWQHHRVVTRDYFVADAWNHRHYLIYREWVGSRDERI